MPYEPIKFVKMLSGTGIPPLIHVPEAAAQTFKAGVPVALTGGFVTESAFGGTELVYGVSQSPGQNLAVAGTRQDLSEAKPPNQPNAVTIPVGAWLREGKTYVLPALDEFVFSAMLQTGDVYTPALIGPARYALIKDVPSGFFFIDKDGVGTNDEHAVNIIGVDPASPNSATKGSRVWFVFAAAARFFG